MRRKDLAKRVSVRLQEKESKKAEIQQTNTIHKDQCNKTSNKIKTQNKQTKDKNINQLKPEPLQKNSKIGMNSSEYIINNEIYYFSNTQKTFVMIENEK